MLVKKKGRLSLLLTTEISYDDSDRANPHEKNCN